MSHVDRITGRNAGVRRSSGRRSARTAKDLPLDHQLTFKREAGEEWKFRDGRIFVNGCNIEEVLEFETRDVRLWCGISDALMAYKDEVARRGGKHRSKFFARLTAVQEKVLGNMKRLYDEKTEGFYLSLGDGECLFNNFNVRAFLAMYHLRPTEKARMFLFGLKSKLALILVNKNGTSQYERVHRVIQLLYEEVIDALEIAPIERRRIASRCGDGSV